ncbi:hypothetical protein [Kribbella sp. NPDC048928]|uniref:hypothetical protein n=1 Tax=Kribbella sp. NPDC048928 TaxID=3364111 RepID=UPI003719EFA4
MFETASSGGNGGRNKKLWTIVLAAVVAVALAAGATTVLVIRANRDKGQASPGAGPSASATAPANTPTTAPGRSAAAALAPFFTRADALDRQLKAAAAAINAAGPPWTAADPAVERKVRAADLQPVAAPIPAGMKHDLQQSVVLVLSDLASRRAALTSFQNMPPGTPHSGTANLLSELRRGHVAAARFDRDLAAARSMASVSSPIAVVPRDSRLVAEVLLLVRYVETANAGCDSRGGAVITHLPAITWGAVPDSPEADGTAGGIAFDAAFERNAWTIDLHAC